MSMMGGLERGCDGVFFTGYHSGACLLYTSFHVKEAESIGIVGESGSGKSVTMLSVMGLLPNYATITADSLLFDGKELTKMTPKELRALHGSDIGMVFQDPMTSLNPLFTVQNQLMEPLRIHQHLSLIHI